MLREHCLDLSLFCKFKLEFFCRCGASMMVIVVMLSVVIASFSESLRDRLADRDSGFSLGIVGSLNSVAVSS